MVGEGAEVGLGELPALRRFSNTTIDTRPAEHKPEHQVPTPTELLPISYVNQVGTTNQAMMMRTPTMTAPPHLDALAR